MANPAVEKLKVLGLRHGEKAVVGVCAVLAVVMVAKGLTKETYPSTPDDLKKAASLARSNLDREQKEPDILAKLESPEFNIKEVGFEKVVQAKLSTQADATKYVSDNPWVTPEPGAGLLRSDPVLIAVNDLYTKPNRGGLVVFQRTEAGDLVLEEEPAEAAKKGARKSEPAKPSTKSVRDNRRLGETFSGPMDKGKADEKDEPVEEKRAAKEAVKGYRWAALTAVLDHDQLRQNYAKALRIDVATAFPHYLRVDSERQTMKPDGTWPSKWDKVDRETNQDVLIYTPEHEEELAEPATIVKNLVDPLPFLQVGNYQGVHVGMLVPKEKRSIAATNDPGDAGRGPGSSMAGVGGPGGGPSRPRSGGMSMPGPGSGGSPATDGSDSPRGMSMPGGQGRPQSGGGGPDDSDVVKTEAPNLMVRVLDFTVEADETYRYRIRIVVRNPNLGVEMVVPGADNKAEEMFGPWSAPSEAVSIPADVATYALDKGLVPGDPRELIKFQVVRFDPVQGLIVVNNFENAVGQSIGETKLARVPKPDYNGEERRSIDFDSRQIVLDTEGGPLNLGVYGSPGTPLVDPYRALLTKPDGTIVLRDQARDVDAGDWKEMKAMYDETIDGLKTTAKKKKRKSGGGMPGMSKAS